MSEDEKFEAVRQLACANGTPTEVYAAHGGNGRMLLFWEKRHALAMVDGHQASVHALMIVGAKDGKYYRCDGETGVPLRSIEEAKRQIALARLTSEERKLLGLE